ncbi:hypothetical protein BH721_04490 [Clostridium baratii]|uniref:helix-turn-helix domain-containing protein n=1 Tax=Clostridium baratii TaxID=1561 RepID=UPI0009A35897|nr:helix-turn-helix domain-containing protein [Clostridium baratii]OPF52519.1 hypothetical protein A1M12_10695 [Clostridium baratii]OPF55967.1 hypothetical protein BH721_04490 [Clostridium baratii]OPF58439.1 hypothetical protein BH724_06090 [Clostridium baratii]OPF59651.1 hypothetical protein BH725_03435 [Clostridium baratii]
MGEEVLRESNRWEEFNSIIDNEDLDIKEKGLLLILFRFINYKTGYANPSRTLIKKLTNITDNRTLDKLINTLIKKGLLKRESGKGNRSKYFIEVGGEITPSVKNVPSVGITPTVGVEITPLVGGGITPQKENKRKTKENIYTSSEDEDSISYFERINKEIDDLETEINNKYDKDLIQKEKDKIISKNLSGLPLLKELKKELENHNKKIKKEQSNRDIEDIWKLYPRKEGKQKSIKNIPKILNKHSKEELIRCIERYIKETEGKDKQYILMGSTFFNGRYEDYLDSNYEELRKANSKEIDLNDFIE